MHCKFRNVNDAFQGLVRNIHEGVLTTDVRPSRYGEVVEVAEPVLLTYTHPLERVLFNQTRDCNPFALLYEALYMLAGRNDVAPLAYYTKRFAEFSDNGSTLNDAYGYRWCHAIVDEYHGGETDYAVDQLELLVKHLEANPWSRRAVLQMWNVEDDLLKADTSKAVCCNLSVVFAVEPGVCKPCNGTGEILNPNTAYYHPCAYCGGKPHDVPRYLNMTVFNRSNDLVWGLLGANYVTFTVLQEYLAAQLGLDVGKYHHCTANLHAYTNNWKPEEWLADTTFDSLYGLSPSSLGAIYEQVPLVQDPVRFGEELPDFVEHHSRDALAGNYTEPFLRGVAQPLCVAFHHYKHRDYLKAQLVADTCKANDWRTAATRWLQRRGEKYHARRQTSK